MSEYKPRGFHTTASLGRLIGKCPATIWRICKQNPGFALQAGNHFRIPDDHAERFLAGEHPRLIATNPSYGRAA